MSSEDVEAYSYSNRNCIGFVSRTKFLGKHGSCTCNIKQCSNKFHSCLQNRKANRNKLWFFFLLSPHFCKLLHTYLYQPMSVSTTRYKHPQLPQILFMPNKFFTNKIKQSDLYPITVQFNLQVPQLQRSND